MHPLNHPRICAIGVVLRDHMGRFMCLFSSPISPLKINCAEILAIFRAIQISLANIKIKAPLLLLNLILKMMRDGVMNPWVVRGILAFNLTSFIMQSLNG